MPRVAWLIVLRVMRIYWIFFVLIALVLLAAREYSLLPDGRVHAHIFDVGQGDGILLTSPSGKQIVIDGGPNMDLLEHLENTMPFFDRTIELLVLTHPDSDHITSLPEVLRRYQINHIMLSGAIHYSGKYDAFLALIEQYKIPVLLPDPDFDVDIGDGLVLDVIWPTFDAFGVKPDNANNPSVVLRAIFGSGSLLLTGDIEEEAEAAILASGADVRASIIKVPHHGSRTSSSIGFLLAVAPKQALISSGRNNDFGHPHREIVERYESMNVKTQYTATSATLHISW